MRLVLATTVLLLASACTGRDAQCSELAVEAATLAASAQTCTEDTDCIAVFGTIEPPVCGESARLFIGEGCAFGVNSDFSQSRFDELREEFRALGCASRPIEGCGELPPRRCEKGDAATGICVVDAAPECREHGSNPLDPDAGTPEADAGSELD